jgi:hypothetical protein
VVGVPGASARNVPVRCDPSPCPASRWRHFLSRDKACLGPSRASTACAPLQRCGVRLGMQVARTLRVRAKSDQFLGGSVFADARRPRARACAHFPQRSVGAKAVEALDGPRHATSSNSKCVDREDGPGLGSQARPTRRGRKSPVSQPSPFGAIRWRARGSCRNYGARGIRAVQAGFRRMASRRAKPRPSLPQRPCRPGTPGAQRPGNKRRRQKNHAVAQLGICHQEPHAIRCQVLPGNISTPVRVALGKQPGVARQHLPLNSRNSSARIHACVS